MERYNLLKYEVGKGKYFKNRKVFFEWIAEEMHLQSNKKEQQVTSWFYTLKRRNKKKFRATASATVLSMTQGMVVDMNDC